MKQESIIKSSRSKVDLKLQTVRKRSVNSVKEKEVLDKHQYIQAPSVFRVIKDVGEIAASGRIEDAWKNEVEEIALSQKFDRDRLPSEHKPFSPSWILKMYKLRGIEFGNWTSQEDRLNYTFALALSLYDLKNILGFSYRQIGFNGKLGVAFGARGNGGKAVAHFEPRGFVINLTRYPEGNEIINGGGVGAFSHEWAHALDFYLGRKDKITRNNWITGGNEARERVIPDFWKKYPGTPKAIAEQILDKLVWKKTNETYTTYFKNMLKTLKDTKKGDYWIRRNELFARAFESWLQKKMKKAGMRNNFLTKKKYAGEFYPDNNLLQKVDPLFEKLLQQARNTI